MLRMWVFNFSTEEKGSFKEVFRAQGYGEASNFLNTFVTYNIIVDF